MFGGGGKARRKALTAAAAAVAGVVTAVVLVTTLGGDDEPAAATTAGAEAAITAPAGTEPPATTASPTTPPPATTPPTATPTTAPPTTPPTTLAPPTAPATTLLAAAPGQQLTEPIAPPADEYAREPVIALGTLSIPRIGVEMTMYEGIRLTTLDLGPGHWPGSAMPGSSGNVVVGGHRTSKHKVFRKIDQLVAGDEIVFTGADGSRHVYVVNRVEVVEPTDMWIVDPTPSPTATLFACHPPGSTAERIVAFADFRETIPAT